MAKESKRAGGLGGLDTQREWLEKNYASLLWCQRRILDWLDTREIHRRKVAGHETVAFGRDALNHAVTIVEQRLDEYGKATRDVNGLLGRTSRSLNFVHGVVWALGLASLDDVRASYEYKEVEE